MFEITTLASRIAVLFEEKLNLEVPDAQTDLIDTGLLDSLAFVELLLLLEQEFDANITADNLEIDNFRTITRIASFIVNHDVVKDAAL